MGKIFKELLEFSMEINIFLPVNAKLGCVNNVSGVYKVVISLLLIGQQGWGHIFRHRLLLSMSYKILKTVSQRQGKLSNKMPLTFREAPAASQSNLLQINFTPLVISRDRLKYSIPRTLQSQLVFA